MLRNNLVYLGILILAGVTNGVSLSTDKLTTNQRILVADLRELLKDDLTEEHMSSEYYLTNWLDAHQFNVENTKEAIKKYLQVRKEQNLANILNEDWSDMRTLFPYSRNTVDKTGQPLVYVDMAQWDVASYLTTQEASDRLLRYHFVINEESGAHVRRLRAKGQNVSKYSYIVNIGGFSPGKHLCKHCTQFYSSVANMLTPFAPVTMDKIFFVNVPHPFKMVYFLWSEDTRKLIRLVGQDQVQLAEILNEHIDQDQVPNGILNQLAQKENSEGLMIWDKEL